MLQFNDLILAYWDCRKPKRNKESSLKYDVLYLSKLVLLWEKIISRTYYPSTSYVFIVTKPTPREIFASDFEARIIHHLINIKFKGIIDASMIDEVCNNRIGKGTHACVNYVNQFLSVSKSTDVICKIDMKGFFMSINKKILINKFHSFIDKYYFLEDKDILKWLIKVTILYCPQHDCERRSPIKMWDLIEPHKSLFNKDDNIGIPIGHLLAQLSIHVLLNSFDHFMKKHFPLYTRYVDDCFLVGSKDKILSLLPTIREKLNMIGLSLHPNKFYMQNIYKGVSAVGSYVFKNRIYINNRSVTNAQKAFEKLNKLFSRGKINIDYIQAIVNSYLGMFKNKSTYNIRKFLISTLSNRIKKFFVVHKNNSKIIISKQTKNDKRIKQQRERDFRIKTILDLNGL